MKTRYFTPLLAAGLALGAPHALADNDELAAALILGGAGAAIGHSIDGGDGAVVGGFLGALLGAAIADDNDRDGYGRHSRVYRRPPPPVYFVGPPPAHRWRDEWREHRRDWRDDHWHDRRGRDERRWRDDDWRGRR